MSPAQSLVHHFREMSAQHGTKADEAYAAPNRHTEYVRESAWRDALDVAATALERELPAILLIPDPEPVKDCCDKPPGHAGACWKWDVS